MPIWSPEKGTINSRIFREAEDEQATKAISIEDTAYWFADSGGALLLLLPPLLRPPLLLPLLLQLQQVTHVG